MLLKPGSIPRSCSPKETAIRILNPDIFSADCRNVERGRRERSGQKWSVALSISKRDRLTCLASWWAISKVYRKAKSFHKVSREPRVDYDLKQTRTYHDSRRSLIHHHPYRLARSLWRQRSSLQAQRKRSDFDHLWRQRLPISFQIWHPPERWKRSASSRFSPPSEIWSHF